MNYAGNEEVRKGLEKLTEALYEVYFAEISAHLDKLLPQTGDEEKTTTRPVRKPLPSHLPRVEKVIPPVESRCPECDEPLHFIRNEVSEKMEYIPARVVVNRYICPQYSCPCCEKVFSGKMPAHIRRFSRQLSLYVIKLRHAASFSGFK